MMFICLSIFLYALLFAGINGDRVHPNMPKRPIDGYCDAWTRFEDTGVWSDDWDSIDYDIKKEEDRKIKELYMGNYYDIYQAPIISKSPSNIYDVYNADECRRIRRPWNGMSQEERQLYVDGLLELRHRGQLKMELDEFVAVASVHDDHFGSVTHHDSDYMFWHGYLVWELESRIRNLGGRFRCFGMPYWDITNEYYHIDDRDDDNDGDDYLPQIFQTGLGGYGDPDDAWKVNGYSWDVTTKQFWSPDHNFACTAEGDLCPVCSVKRDSSGEEEGFPGLRSSAYYGNKITTLSDFKDFQQWMVSEVGLPHSIDNSYDPIWYLFHSFESYMQAMWVNCNDYDTIDDLRKFPHAFSPYCEPYDDHIDLTVNDCVGIGLQENLFFDGLLPKREWSYIHNNELDIKKLYFLPQWNIIYDLNDDAFFDRSGLSEQCKGKLHKEWFMLPSKSDDQYKNEKELIATGNGKNYINGMIPSHLYQILTLGIIIIFCGILTVSKINSFRNKRNKHSKLLDTEYEYSAINAGYGSV